MARVKILLGSVSDEFGRQAQELSSWFVESDHTGVPRVGDTIATNPNEGPTRTFKVTEVTWVVSTKWGAQAPKALVQVTQISGPPVV